MKKILCFLVFLAAFLSSMAQTKIDFGVIDSTVIEVYRHTSKEMVTKEEDAGWLLLSHKHIPKKQSDKLIKFLQEPSNFSEDRALLTHDNVQIYFYSEGKLLLAFHLSTLTRNMFIEDGRVHRTWSITPRSAKKIKKILKKIGVLQLISEDMQFPN